MYPVTTIINAEILNNQKILDGAENIKDIVAPKIKI